MSRSRSVPSKDLVSLQPNARMAAASPTMRVKGAETGAPPALPTYMRGFADRLPRGAAGSEDGPVGGNACAQVVLFPKASGDISPTAEALVGDAAGLRELAESLRLDRDHQVEQRKIAQRREAQERFRADNLAKQNHDLMQAAEERLQCLQGHQHMSDIETSELSAQVQALLHVKKNLFRRLQDMEAERNSLVREVERASGEHLCVACCDRLANTVILRCRHLCVCDGCARKLTNCPICRQPVKDRLVVFGR
mmetsp:Transcript_124665/g.248844  ORF Transcript_124665/g.248844 Transcript_124665/m.248844 type:complete len:252 (+) Transcript_124665:63-818(+)